MRSSAAVAACVALVLVASLAGCLQPGLEADGDDDSSAPAVDTDATDGDRSVGDGADDGVGGDSEDERDDGAGDDERDDGSEPDADGERERETDRDSDCGNESTLETGASSDGGEDEDDDDENVTATFLAPECNATVTLEVAATASERREGLMHRESLPENHGMVFVYPDAGNRSFWMKNTLIPLDIIYLDADRRVLNVEHADPQPNASNSELERYHSDGPAQYVIELEQGFANETGVEPGTEVVFHDDLEVEDEE